MAAPPATPAEERRAVLFFAAEKGRSDIAGQALDEERKDPEGGDVGQLLRSRQENTEDTPLHVACQHGNVDVVRVLLLRGAAPELRNAAGRTAFDVAAGGTSQGHLASQQAFEAVHHQALVFTGRNLAAAVRQVSLAVWQRSPAVCQELLAAAG